MVLILAIIVHVVVTQTKDGPGSEPSIKSGTDSGIEAEPRVNPTVNAEPALEVIPETSNEAITASLAIPKASAATNEAIPAGPENSAAGVKIKASSGAIRNASPEPGSEPVSG